MTDLSLQILNAIRGDLGADYESRIPEATRENIASVGNTILSYQPTTNSFLTALLNRISKTVVEHMASVDDIYSMFKDERLPFGDTIQRIFVDIPKAKPFDGTATVSMLSQEKGAIHVEYTKVDRKIFYKQTISIPQLKEAFVNPQALDNFITAITESMARALSYDKYIMLTYTLAEHAGYVKELHDGSTNNNVTVLAVPATVAQYNKATKQIEWDTVGAKAFLKALRIGSRALKFPHKLTYGEYDSEDKAIKAKGEISAITTPISKQIVALEVSSLAEIDVEALAVLFNMDKAKPESRILELQDGALGLHTNVNDSEVAEVYLGGFVCDVDAVERGTSYEDTDSFKNPEGQYVNLWNHYWGYMAVSKFKDFMPIVFSVKAEQSSESEGE